MLKFIGKCNENFQKDMGYRVRSLVIDNGISEIGRFVFSGLNHLRLVFFPYTLTRIRYWAFSNCERLEYVCIPSSVVLIEHDAFYDCRRLKEVKFQAGGDINTISCIKSINSLSLVMKQMGKSRPKPFIKQLVKFLIPSLVIRYNAFSGCNELRSVYIPRYVEVEDNAFDKGVEVKLGSLFNK